MIFFEYQLIRGRYLLVAINDNECEICGRTQMECEISSPWRNHAFIPTRCPASRMPPAWRRLPNSAPPPVQLMPIDDQKELPL